jgi:hypothetical protein
VGGLDQIQVVDSIASPWFTLALGQKRALPVSSLQVTV